MKENDLSRYAVDILDVVQIVFLILKLTDLIDWSWFVVLIPLFIQLGILFVSVIVLLVICICYKKNILGW